MALTADQTTAMNALAKLNPTNTGVPTTAFNGRLTLKDLELVTKTLSDDWALTAADKAQFRSTVHSGHNSFS